MTKHALEQKKSITARRKHQGYTREIKDERRHRRRLERRWRRSKLAIDRVKFVKQKEKLKKMLEDVDTEFLSTLVMENSMNSKMLLNALNKIFRRQEVSLPQHHSVLDLADGFIYFFTEKVAKIKDEINSSLSVNNCDALHCQAEDQKYEHSITAFRELEETEVINLITKSTTTSCDLDPIPTLIIKRCNKAIQKL